MVIGIPWIKLPLKKCEGYLLGKQHRKSFKNQGTKRATQPLQLVHTDICGPIQPMTLGGNKYFLIFTDDFTGKTWVYNLKEQSETFQKLKEFKSLVEKQSEYYIKAIRFDCGGQFTSKEFQRFCKENGIIHQRTIPYTPQQNGVS